MDRPFYYTGYVLRTLDLLNASKMGMVGLGRLMLDLFGTGTYVGGLPLTATAPASMAVLAGPGAIYALENVDNTAYSLISGDTANQIVKQGLLLQPGITLATPAPVTAGQSINYLIQGTYQDADISSSVLSYYNSANPAVPFSGPGNTGASQATVRAGQFIVAVKAGIPATTGTQATPAPDAGYVGLYVVSVPSTATTITSANISVFSGAPFLSILNHPGFSNIQVFLTGGAFVPPAGVTRAKVRLIGGGGAGGGGNTSFSGGSGAAGGYSEGIFTVAPFTAYPVTVPAAAAGAAAGVAGATGGTVSFSSLISATGGTGGASNGSTFAGGAPGIGIGGTVNLTGGYGCDGSPTTANIVGPGGASALGGGGRSGGASGVAGVAPGSGGGGSYGPAGNGGSGAPGIVIVEW